MRRNSRCTRDITSPCQLDTVKPTAASFEATRATNLPNYHSRDSREQQDNRTTSPTPFRFIIRHCHGQYAFMATPATEESQTGARMATHFDFSSQNYLYKTLLRVAASKMARVSLIGCSTSQLELGPPKSHCRLLSIFQSDSCGIEALYVESEPMKCPRSVLN